MAGMGIPILADCIDTTCNAVPILRGLWCWFWEHDMEVEFREPNSKIVRGIRGTNIPDGARPLHTIHVGENPHIYMWLDMELTNHRTNRPEVIKSCDLHLKARHWRLWKKTIARAPVLLENPNHSLYSFQNGLAWKPLRIEPQSLPVILTVEAEGPIEYPIKELPRNLELVLEFGMVGPHRRVRKLLGKYSHDPDTLTKSL
jgi:hypothetical protein